MELIEDQPGRRALGKSTQSNLPPPPPKSSPPAPQPSLPSRTEQADSKRKREQKGEEERAERQESDGDWEISSHPQREDSTSCEAAKS